MQKQQKKNKKQAKNYTGAEICIVKSIKNLFKNFKKKPLKFFHFNFFFSFIFFPVFQFTITFLWNGKILNFSWFDFHFDYRAVKNIQQIISKVFISELNQQQFYVYK